VNEAIAKMKSEKSFDRLAEKYMAKEKAILEAQGLPFVFD
jgi:hypothetical protein